jgi:hypothetical protein
MPPSNHIPIVLEEVFADDLEDYASGILLLVIRLDPHINTIEEAFS